MSFFQSELSPPPLSTSRKLAGPALAAGAVGVLVAASFVLGTYHQTLSKPVAEPSVAADPCGLPAGVTLANLDAQGNSLIARRLLTCADRQFGRITDAQYREAIAKLDAEWPTALPHESNALEIVEDPRSAISWASSVRGYSSQYTATSWAATQALGAPNVFPGHGDNANAWASLGADDRDEWLEVGFERPTAISAVEVYETFNAGAVGRVELITTTGRRIDAHAGGLAVSGEGSARRSITVSCTSEPIVAVRVHVNSLAVAGWNEIDAIGVVPCSK